MPSSRENKKDIEGNYLKAIELAPAFAERLRGARREARFAGAAVPNYFRKPYGPGWALVGDAGYNKDFITAQGITGRLPRRRALRDRPRRAFAGARPFDEAMGDTSARATTGQADVRLHLPARDARAAAAGCSSCSGPFTATRRRWTVSRG